MKKIYLQKMVQHGLTCYMGKADPRDLVRVAKKIEMGDTQDAQRPLNKKRVKDIAKYIAAPNGILPTTLTLATSDNSRFEVKPCTELENTYFIEFPTTEKEFRQYHNEIDVMDGQHRLYSFADDLRVISDDEDYEMGFTLYIRPSLQTRRWIFTTCNDKQEKVSGNLLMWFREQLGLLEPDEEAFYALVQKLNNDAPLKGHIIMSAEKVKNGVKAKEVIAIFKQAKINDMLVGGRPLSSDEKFDIIRKYLFAWEKVVGFSFQTSGKEAGAAIKIAGLRYMLFLLPSIWERAISSRIKSKDFEDFCMDTLKRMISSFGVAREEFFTCENHKMFFRERTATQNFAKTSIGHIQRVATENFNPFG